MSCPVDHSQHSTSSPPSPSCPVDHTPQTPSPIETLTSKTDSCPYSASKQESELISELNNIPPPSQRPHPSQTQPLSTTREKSTIPMSGPYEGKSWIYPSEQMFYNAMRRKNWKPSERDMSVVVPIHNAVNEQAWRHILQWEELHAGENTCGGPKLVKFRGRPKDVTPKARIRNWMGYTLPFDRHDWTVDRCGKTVEYVIDFYSGEPQKEGGVSFYLDVRPKVSVEGMMDRVRMWWKTGTGLW